MVILNPFPLSETPKVFVDKLFNFEGQTHHRNIIHLFILIENIP